MIKVLLTLILIIYSFNIEANTYYRTGKVNNVNDLLNNVNKDIENYCKRNLSEFNKKIDENKVNENKVSRFQLKTTSDSHSHSHNQKLNIDACFNIEKQKFNNIVNIYYKNTENQTEFLKCYAQIRDKSKVSISDNFSVCLSDLRKEKCNYIIKLDVNPNEKAFLYRKCML